MKTLLTLLLLIPSLSWGEVFFFQGYKLNKNEVTNIQKSLNDYGYDLEINGALTLETQNELIKWLKNNKFKNVKFNSCIYEKLVSNPYKYCQNDLIANNDELILSKEDIKNREMNDFKDICLDIGYTAGTEKFADCVMKLYSDNSNSNKSGQISNNNSQSDYMKKQNQLLEQQNKIQQNQLELQKKQHNQKVWNDFMDAINPKPKLNCRQVGWNTVCY